LKRAAGAIRRPVSFRLRTTACFPAIRVTRLSYDFQKPTVFRQIHGIQRVSGVKRDYFTFVKFVALKAGQMTLKTVVPE
jgi:hypothetical protein